MANFGVAPIVIVTGGQATTIAVTDASGVAVDVFTGPTSGTKVTQPYLATGKPSVTLWRPLQAASESLLITALIEGEPAARQTVTVTYPAGATVTLAAAPASIATSETASFNATYAPITGSAKYPGRPGGTSVIAAVLPQFNPMDYGALGDNTADDTAAFQAAVTAAVAARGRLVSPAPGTAYKITDTINIVPASGNQCYLDIDASGIYSAINFVPSTARPLFSIKGLKHSAIQGVKIDLTNAPSGSIAWDIDTSSSYPSTSSVSFKNCYVNMPATTNLVGWRMGHISGGAADISSYQWENCAVLGGAGSAIASGQVGWQDQGANTLNLMWFGGFGSFLEKMYSNNGSTGSTYGSGQGSKWFYGLGGSHNKTDFDFRGIGQYSIFGGRFEQGQRLLDVGSNSAYVGVICANLEIDNYNPSDNIVFNVAAPGHLVLDTITLAHPTTNYNVNCITFSGQTLDIRNGAFRADDPFYSNSFGETFLKGANLINGSFTVSATKFKTQAGRQASAKTLTYGTSVATDASTGRVFPIFVTDAVAFTIANPTNPQYIGQIISYDISAPSGGTGTISWGAQFVAGNATGLPTSGPSLTRRTVSFYWNGANWIQL